MNSRRFWLFFMLMMILLLPLSTASADPVYGSGIFPMAGQYPGAASYQYMVNTQAAKQYAGKWRPSHPQVTRARFIPGTYNRYQGYQFRPWNQNYRYRPNFLQHHSNYQAYQYRWRPIPQPASYRRNAPGMPEFPMWQAAYYPVGQSTARASSWVGGPGIMPPVAAYGNTTRSYRQGRMNVGNTSGRVYRSTNITIPNHYVFRPLRPRTQMHSPGKFVDSTQQRLAKDYYAAPNKMPGRFSFRPLEAAQQTNDSQFDSTIRVPNAQLRTVSTGRAKIAQRPTFKPLNFERDRYSHQPASGYTFRQQYRRIPPARFRYPVNIAARPPVASYWPGVNYRPANPYNGYTSHYPGNRYQQQTHPYTTGYSNSYDRAPVSDGSWDFSGESRDWPLVSQSAQREYEYPLTEFEGSSF